MHQETLPGWTTNYLNAWRGRLLINQRHFTEAEHLLSKRDITVDSALGFPREIESLVLARLLIAQGQSQPQRSYLVDALRLLERLHNRFEAMGWIDKLIETQVLQALALQAQANKEAALTTLSAAISVAEPEGYTRVFVGEGVAIVPLLHTLTAQGIETAYINHLLTECPSTAPVLPIDNQPLIDPVSDRELEVLHQIAQGATNQETALALHIAVGTVKNHLKNIYRKLDVHNRTQAIVRSRELGLID
jgi:LuxR family maltose regulon positive regulatory protein